MGIFTTLRHRQTACNFLELGVSHTDRHCLKSVRPNSIIVAPAFINCTAAIIHV